MTAPDKCLRLHSVALFVGSYPRIHKGGWDDLKQSAEGWSRNYVNVCRPWLKSFFRTHTEPLFAIHPIEIDFQSISRAHLKNSLK